MFLLLVFMLLLEAGQPYQSSHLFKSMMIMSTPSIPNKSYWNSRKKEPRKEDAFEVASTSSIKMPTIILVNPFLDANVGSVARAMLNFGMTELRVVNPRCNIHSESAYALAAGAVDVLKNAKVFDTLEECVSDLQRVIATTARTRDMTNEILTPQAAAVISLNHNQSLNVGIVFGRERNGLTNEELGLADSYIAIPTFNYFPSINLAQAVNIVSYEIWKRRVELEEYSPREIWLRPKDGDRIARREDLDSFLARLEQQLTARDYINDPVRRQQSFRNIRGIYQRILLSKSEIDTLHGVLTSIVKPVEMTESEPAKESE